MAGFFFGAAFLGAVFFAAADFFAAVAFLVGAAFAAPVFFTGAFFESDFSATGVSGAAVAAFFFSSAFFLLARFGNRSAASGANFRILSRTALLKGADEYSTANGCTNAAKSIPFDLGIVLSKPGIFPLVASLSLIIPKA